MLRKSSVVLFAFLLLGIQPVYSAEFFCPSGDVTCLIAAINEAMRTPDDDTIFLEAGSYVLTSVDNITDGMPWGLPTTGRAGSGRLTIEGAGMWSTDISRDRDAPEFGLFFHGGFGPGGFRTLHLKNLGLFFGVNGVRAFGGSVRLENVAFIGNGSGIVGLNTAGFTIQNSYIAFNGTGVSLREAFARIERSTIGSNRGNGIGTNDMFSCVEIVESSIWNNGIGASAVICSIVNSSITGNAQGGISHIACCGPNPNIDSTTIARNGGFGIMVRGQPSRPRIRLRNTIVAENAEGDCGTLGPFGW